MSKVGVLGGAFNPPHLGHLILAQEAQFQLGLDRILLIPTGRAPHKAIEADPGGRERLAMVEAAVEGIEGWEASPIEVERAAAGPDPTYMVETIEQLLVGDPSIGRPVIILGSDAAVAIGEWERPRDLAAIADFALTARPGGDTSAAGAALEAIGAGSVDLVTMPQMDISSTEIRERIRAGKPVRFLVPEAVARVIVEQGAYR